MNKAEEAEFDKRPFVSCSDTRLAFLQETVEDWAAWKGEVWHDFNNRVARPGECLPDPAESLPSALSHRMLECCLTAVVDITRWVLGELRYQRFLTGDLSQDRLEVPSFLCSESPE